MTTRGLGDVRAVVAVVIGALGSVWLLGFPFHPFGFEMEAGEVLALWGEWPPDDEPCL